MYSKYPKLHLKTYTFYVQAEMAKLLLTFYGFLAIIFGLLFGLSATDFVDNAARAVLVRVRFLLLLETIMSFGTFFLWKQVTNYTHFRPGKFHSRGKTVVQAGVGSIAFCAHFSYFSNYVVGADPHWVALVLYSCLGVYVQLIVYVFTVVALEYLYGWCTAKASEGTHGNHKLVFKKYFWITAFVYSFGIGAVGLYNTQIRQPEIRSTNVKLKNLPPTFKNVKIVQINDIHLGPTVGKSRLESIVRTVEDIHAGNRVTSD